MLSLMCANSLKPETFVIKNDVDAIAGSTPVLINVLTSSYDDNVDAALALPDNLGNTVKIALFRVTTDFPCDPLFNPS